MSTLYAPQVEPMQPAVTVGAGINIYYSISKYNTSDEYNAVRVTLVDPSLSSGWGANSMLKDEGGKTIDYIQLEKPEDNYITIPASNLKTLTPNQFYQAQVYLVNGTQVSQGSQVTLVRVVNQGIIVFEGLEDNTPFISEVKGYLKYANVADQIETISSYQIIIGTETFPIVENEMGLNFSYPVNIQLDEQAVNVTIKYTTIHNYSGEYSVSIQGQPLTLEDVKVTVKEDCELGMFYLLVENLTDVDEYIWQRRVLGEEWEVIAGNNNNIYDYTIESGVLYQYRLLYRKGINWFESQSSETVSMFLEDMYFIDETGLFINKYNPKINNFKLMTQEKMVTPLGGSYPIAIRSSNTRYRQFTVEGLLSIEYDLPLYLSTSAATDSISNPVGTEYPTKAMDKLVLPTRLMRLDEQYAATEQIKSFRSTTAEKLYRDAIIDFITNGKPKLFRSGPEGNILVYLSNPTFTPMTSLGRNIYSFSATATEIDEVTSETLKKYNIGG